MPKTQAECLTTWQHRLRAMNENEEALLHLETRRDKLQGVCDAANIAVRDQAAARAAKQDASRRLEELLDEGRKVDLFLVAGLREHYGKESEKLAEFLIQPYRGRRAKKEDEAPAPPPPPVE
ncbi:MAG TPA: hypothetical protein VFR31_20755 [Thermoanaerobaculia bacterium]|nr:hypothetical protein [Thermoanaerobaculia bacterium]